MQPDLPKHPADHHVVVLGASPKPARYSNQAIRLLKDGGYRITPIHPNFEIVEEIPVLHQLDAITSPVDTLTLYVGPANLDKLLDDVIALRPGRVIFNPGSESAKAQMALDAANIHWLNACTLVMLRTGLF